MSRAVRIRASTRTFCHADRLLPDELVGAVRIAELDWTAVDDAASSAKELVMGTQLVLAADVVRHSLYCHSTDAH